MRARVRITAKSKYAGIKNSNVLTTVLPVIWIGQPGSPMVSDRLPG